jgi:hypothetical protein
MNRYRLRATTVTLLAAAAALMGGVNPSNASAKTKTFVALPLGAASISNANDGSLETAASRASNLGRTIALSLIGLALAVAAVVLVFRRDFKEAIGLLVIGVIAVMLASPVGLSVLQDTVSTLFGSG